MNLPNALGVAEDTYTEGFQNIIANIFQVVLVNAPVISPHEFPQLEPTPTLKVNAFINS